MGLRYPNQKDSHCFFVTTSFKDRQTLGNTDGLYEKMAHSLNYCSKKYEASIAAYVFMPSHIHLLLFIDGAQLSGFVRDFKKFIAQKVGTELGIASSGIWMPRYDRVAIATEDVFTTKLEYIHNNPVKARLVAVAEDWPWSSAGDYLTDREGIVKITKDW